MRNSESEIFNMKKMFRAELLRLQKDRSRESFDSSVNEDRGCSHYIAST